MADVVTPVGGNVIEAEAETTEVEVAATKKLGIAGWFAVGWLSFAAAVAILVPWLPLKDYTEPSVAAKLATPLKFTDFPLGADKQGHDMIALLAWGLRYSLFVGFGAITIGVVVGGTIGLFAGYFRGWIDTLMVGVTSVLLAIPQLVLALALVAMLASDYNVVDRTPDPVNPGKFVENIRSVAPTPERRMFVLIFALGIVSIPILARITRANTLVWSQREFVAAAKAQGAKNFRIIFKEVLPNVLPAMFSIALLGVAVVIVAEAGLSFLNAGLPVERPSLGQIISGGGDALAIQGKPHVVFEPVIVIFFTVMSLNFLGDVVRARFDVRDSAV